MKHKIISVLIFISFALTAHSQKGVYYLTKYLREQYKESSKAIILDASVKAELGRDVYKGAIVTKELLDSNPFLKNLFDKPAGSRIAKAFIGPIINSIANLDVTNVTDGLAKFLVNRTKEELSVSFFVQLKDDIKKYDELQLLFPQTFDLLNQIDSRIYQYSSYLTELRDAFIIDLNNLPDNFVDVLNLDKYNKYFDDHKWVKTTLNSISLLGKILVDKKTIKNPDYFINALENSADIYFPLRGAANSASWDTTINGSIKSVYLISESLRSADTSKYWIDMDSLKLLLNDDIAMKIYLGLIYAKADNLKIVFAGNRSLNSFLDIVATNYTQFNAVIKSRLTDFVRRLKTVRQNYNLIKSINNSNTKDSLYRYYYAIYNSSLYLLQDGLKVIQSFQVADPDDFAEFINLSNNIWNIYLNVAEKKYAVAILCLINVSDKMIKSTNSKFVKKISIYGTFAAEMANAENSDQVASIIQNTVLPTGSSYIKKHSVFNISLQAYTGFYAGRQKQATDTKYITAAGVYAPIGIAASWGFRNRTKNKIIQNPASFSIFASLIDVGPIVSFRFSNENDIIANNIRVRLAQIVSPGLHAVFGLPKVPLSAGIGCNLSPLLTNIEKDNITVNSKNAFRFQAFIAVDIPFLNFYNRPR